MNTFCCLLDIFKAQAIALISINIDININIHYIILAIVSITSPITKFIGQV